MSEEYGSVFGWFIIILMFIGLFVLFGFVFTSFNHTLSYSSMNKTLDNSTFSGKLGMVTYEHGWFGIGTTGTTLSFENGTDVLQFTFSQDLPVEMGKNYTVNYQIETITYYGVDKEALFSGLFYHNSTTIIPKNILLEEK